MRTFGLLPLQISKCVSRSRVPDARKKQEPPIRRASLASTLDKQAVANAEVLDYIW